MREVQLSLSTGTRRKRLISFEFRTDVFQFLFGQKGVTTRDSKIGYKSFNSEDFNPIYFTPGWDIIFDHLGVGCCIHFTVEMKCAIRWSKKLYNKEEDGTLNLKNRYFVEKVYFRLVKCIV